MSDGVYRPILRPRRGELAALHHLDATTATRVMPIIELLPGDRLPQLVRQLPPRTGALAVDVSEIEEPTGPLAEELRFGKVVHGGEVPVKMKDGALSFEITSAPPKKPRRKTPGKVDTTAK